MIVVLVMLMVVVVIFFYCSVMNVVMHTLRIVEESDVWAKYSALARAGLKTEIR
jgi:hypothetical protein